MSQQIYPCGAATFLDTDFPALGSTLQKRRKEAYMRGISKPFLREVPQAGPGASKLLQNGLSSSIHVPSTIIPNCPSSKERHGASSSKDKSSLQPPSATTELSCPTYAQVLSQSSLTKPSQSEHQDELKQQVAHILARHPEGMSLFQFRAAYSTTYQNHLPLGNASSAKQRLLEMSDIVCVKGYGVQTLILPVSPEEPSTKPGPPVLSTTENAAMILATAVTAAVPGSQLHPPVSSTSTYLGALGDKESPFLPESLPRRPPKPSIPVAEDVRARAMPGVNLFIPHSAVIVPAKSQVSKPKGIWTSNSVASRPTYLANPSFSVNIPVPSLFQPVLTNMVSKSQQVAYPPLTHRPGAPEIPSLSSALYHSVSRTQSQEAELVSSHLAQPASQNRAMRPTSSIQHTEETDC